jgi:prefoldin subunit 5
MVKNRNREYDLDALKSNLDRCDNNIKTFEDAIAKEYETKKEYQRIIAELEAKKARQDANSN